MANVPNTNTFSFQDVTQSVYNDAAAGRNLSSAFTAATGTFDATYQGSKNQLDDFRNYQSIQPGKYILCLTYSGKALLSSNGGASFSNLGLTPTTNPATVYGQRYNRNGFTGCCMSKTGQYMHITTDAEGWRSANYGASWTMTVPSYAGPACNEDGSVVLIPHTNLIYKSTNYGATWGYLYPPIRKAGDIAYSKDLSLILISGYISDSNYKLSKSTDYGETFSQIDTSTGYYGFNDLAVSGNGQYSGYSKYGGGGFMSSNYGSTYPSSTYWTVTSQGKGGSMSDTGQYMMLGSMFYQHYYSSNYWETVTTWYHGAPYSGYSNFEMSHNGAIRLMSSFPSSYDGEAVLRISTDYGSNWTDIVWDDTSGQDGVTAICMNR